MLALPAPILRVRAAFLPLAARLAFLPPLLTRLALGLIFARSGWGKLHNLERVTKFFDSLGIPAPGANAAFVGTVELVCGALLILGLFTRFSALLLIPTMIVALLTAKRSDIGGFGDLFGMQEYLFIVLLLWLVIAGAGAISADRALFAERRVV